MNLYVWTILDENFYAGVGITVLDTNVESARTVARLALLRDIFQLDTIEEISAYVHQHPGFREDVLMVDEWLTQEPVVYPVDKPMCSVLLYRE